MEEEKRELDDAVELGALPRRRVSAVERGTIVVEVRYAYRDLEGTMECTTDEFTMGEVLHDDDRRHAFVIDVAAALSEQHGWSSDDIVLEVLHCRPLCDCGDDAGAPPGVEGLALDDVTVADATDVDARDASSLDAPVTNAVAVSGALPALKVFMQYACGEETGEMNCETTEFTAGFVYDPAIRQIFMCARELERGARGPLRVP